MPIFATYDRLRKLVLVEFADIVLSASVVLQATGDPLKLRLDLIDNSFIDVYISVSGRYSYHWERRLIGKGVYRHDNAPHKAWKHLRSFPRHFHDGSEDNVVAAQSVKYLLRRCESSASSFATGCWMKQ
jgi:hypothetical protein